MVEIRLMSNGYMSRAPETISRMALRRATLSLSLFLKQTLTTAIRTPFALRIAACLCILYLLTTMPHVAINIKSGESLRCPPVDVLKI